jgi:VWFA-related protein
MKFFLIVLLLVAICPLANAQETEVVRTNVELVQTAITVLDKNGKFVEGLQREQFELMVDGKPRPIAFFERVASGSPRESELAATLGDPAKPVAPSRVPGRTIVFFIDDLHLSADSMKRTSMMLERFLKQEMTTKDNVAITTASGQVGFLEQFTNNRAVLEEAMSRLIPRPYNTEGYSAGGSAKITEYMALQLNTGKSDTKLFNAYIEECMKGSNMFRVAKAMTLPLLRQACENEVKNSSRAILIQAGQVTQNTYHSFESVMRSLSRAPGRKLAFFISDGFLLDSGPNAPNVRDKLDYVIDAAQRAGVVVYTIHARGLVNSGYLDPAHKTPVDERIALNSIGELEAQQDALNAIANDTGGRALRSTNFFDKWVGAVLDETSNYYVIAWRPENEEEKLPKFRNVKLTIAGQPELTVRAPRGYVTGPKPEAAAKASDKPAPAKGPKTPESELGAALSDFYPAGGLPTLLSLTYLNTPANGLVVTSSIEIMGKGVSYGDDGKQGATIKLAGVVLNDKGKVASSFKNQLNIDAPKSGGSDAIFYNHHTPLTPGIYQFRVAARDERSGRVGSAIQWIVVPDLTKNQLTLSSVLLGGQVLEDKSKEGTPHVQLSVDHSFPRTSQLGYWVFVYNSKRDAAGNPQLTVQTTVLRDGQPLLSSPQRRLNSGGQDALRIPFGEELALKTLPPGKYDLKVTVTDGVAGTSATQLADFIVR